jgi:hypothetical protein
LTPDEHRALGVELYNRTWELLEGGAAPDVVVDTAHASAHHWSNATGATVANRARSQWLCSHVYAVLGRPEPALYHGELCLALVESAPEEMEDFDLPAAYETLARSHAAAGQSEETRRYLELARAEIAKIPDAEDRRHLESQLASIIP